MPDLHADEIAATASSLAEQPPVKQFIQVVTTVANADEAQRLARQLVERRLAACVQVTGPVTSTYWWQGAIETATEWRCTVKSRADLYP
ncbi:MAG TPA: divalent-cation tolerance protein CutA, partial [Pirellulales bacterium]